MILNINSRVILKNRTTHTPVNCTVEKIVGQEVTFKSESGDEFTINTRTLNETYIVTVVNADGTTTNPIGEEVGNPPPRRDNTRNHPAPVTIAGDIESYKVKRVHEITTYFRAGQSREENEARIRQELASLANELRGMGYPQDQAALVTTATFVVPLNPPTLSLSAIFKNPFNPTTEMSGSKYMHSYLIKDYLLKDFANIEEVKNFINVIAMNKSGVLLKEFKENKQSLRNIILGLLRIAYSIDALKIEYEYEYNIIYKDQVLDHVVFDFEQYTLNNIIAVIKTQGEGNTSRDHLIELKPEELKRSNIIRLGKVRNTDEMGINEVPEPIRLEFGAGLNYKVDGLKFGKDYLKAIVSNEDLADKLIKFINGALLLYPEMIEDIPENITLVETDFSVFEYRKMIIAAQNVGAKEDGDVGDEDLTQMVEDEKLMDAVQTSIDIKEEEEKVQDATEVIVDAAKIMADEDANPSESVEETLANSTAVESPADNNKEATA